MAIGARIWWYSPKILPSGPYLEKIEKYGNDYTLDLKPTTEISDIVLLNIFEGYTPSNSVEFRESIKHLPSKQVEDDKHHFYVEYIGKYGRMQFHFSHEDGSISQWFEFIPIELPLDTFLNKSIAINLDLNQNNFKVYVRSNRQTVMTIAVKNRVVNKIVWLD